MTDAAVSRPVVVGVDGSTSAVHAVRWAASEAARRKTRLLIVHTYVLVPVHAPQVAGLSATYTEAVLEQGGQWLAEAAKAARETTPHIEVSTELSSGGAAEQLIGLSASAELVVVGSRGLGGFTGLLVGSIAVTLSTHAHCPVIVVREPSPSTTTELDAPVVVGLDGSPTSDAALRFALEAAALRDAPLRAVRAWLDLTVETAWVRGLTAANAESIEAEERRLLSEQLARCRHAFPDVRVEEVLARGRPARSLLDQSASAQLVVAGTRGRGGFRGLLLGSTSQALIHHATCPLAVVPPTQQ